MRVGIFKYQGGWSLFVKAFKELNINHDFINSPSDIHNFDAIIMHGGESSVQYLFLHKGGYIDEIKKFAQNGKIIFSTCAGLILLSNINTKQVQGMGLLDVEVERNSYGKQIVSGLYQSDSDNEIMFIRAPKIVKIGDVEVLDTYKKHPVLVRKNNIIGATFHPELGELDKNNILVRTFLNF